MTIEVKLQLLATVGLLVVMVVAFLVTIRTVGGLQHALDRLETLVKRETDLKVENLILQKKIDIQATRSEAERAKRNEILLNIPILSEMKKQHEPGKKKPEK